MVITHNRKKTYSLKNYLFIWFEALGKEAGNHKKKKCIVVYKPKMAELRLKDIQILPFHVLWTPDFMTITFNRGIFLVKKQMKPFYSILPYFPLKCYPVPIDLKQKNVKEQSHSWKERETDGFFPLRKIVPIKRTYSPQIGLRSWNVTFFIDWKLSARFLFNWNRLLYNFEVFHFFSDHFSLSITVAWIFKWELLTYNKPKIFNFEKVSVGIYHFGAFFPKTCCFVRTLSKQVLVPWKIFNLMNLPLSRKQNSNVWLRSSH